VEGESNTARDEALATLELTLMPATVEEVDAHVVTLLRQAMKVRSAMRRETASPAAREEAERRKQAITGARNVLRVRGCATRRSFRRAFPCNALRSLCHPLCLFFVHECQCALVPRSRPCLP